MTGTSPALPENAANTNATNKSLGKPEEVVKSLNFNRPSFYASPFG